MRRTLGAARGIASKRTGLTRATEAMQTLALRSNARAQKDAPEPGASERQIGSGSSRSFEGVGNGSLRRHAPAFSPRAGLLLRA